jgi:hypothetical protein
MAVAITLIMLSVAIIGTNINIILHMRKDHG